MPDTPAPALRRQLGVADAVVVGIGSMVGAGVFASWAPAADAAGTGLLLGLALAGLVAFCNATSSAQLAACHPESGGTYVYARHRLGPGWGHLAGWGFVVGKTASCVAIALTAGAYLWPSQARLVAAVAVVAVTAVNIGGLSRTVTVTKGLLAITGVALVVIVGGGWQGDADLARLTPIDADLGGILRAGGFLFFAFAGYARIATLGEEVREPERTIPTAIPRALTAVLVLYLVVAVTALATVPVDELATSDAPLQLVVEAGPWAQLAPLVRVGAGIASLGVLLNLVPGISRTVLAMARRRELPSALAAIDTRREIPLRAELAVAAVVLAATVVADLRNALAMSGVAVLTYYALTNASSLRLAPGERRWPRALAVVGLVGCVVLAVALPGEVVVTGTAILAAGVVARRITQTRAVTLVRDD